MRSSWKNPDPSLTELHLHSHKHGWTGAGSSANLQEPLETDPSPDPESTTLYPPMSLLLCEGQLSKQDQRTQLFGISCGILVSAEITGSIKLSLTGCCCRLMFTSNRLVFVRLLTGCFPTVSGVCLWLLSLQKAGSSPHTHSPQTPSL